MGVIKIKAKRKVKINNSLTVFVAVILVLAIVLVSVFFALSNRGSKKQNSQSSNINSEVLSSALQSEIISSEIISSEIISSLPESKPSSSTVVQSQTQTTKPSTPVDPNSERIVKGILIRGTRAMEIVGSNPTQERKYAENVNKFADAVEGIATVYSMVIPKAFVIYGEDSPNYKNSAQKAAQSLYNIRDNLDGVKNVDVYPTLKAHKDEEIYLRTDHHWSAYGAFYAAQELSKVAGVDFADLSTYTVNVKEGFIGSMKGFTGSHWIITSNPENFVTLIPSASYTSEQCNYSFNNPVAHDIFYNKSNYLGFIGGDSYNFKIKSQSCTNGRKLFIIKDSYGNALAPFFMNSFEEIYIADLRYLSTNAVQFIKDNGITDVVFAMCSYSALGSSINSRINTIRTM